MCCFASSLSCRSWHSNSSSLSDVLTISDLHVGLFASVALHPSLIPIDLASTAVEVLRAGEERDFQLSIDLGIQ